MNYDHEYQEKKNKDRDVVHVAMPPRNTCQDRMRYYLAARGLDYKLAFENGWYVSGSRIIIPCMNSSRFNYWQARAMDDSLLRYASPAIPRKDSIVFMWPAQPEEGIGLVEDTVVICEGPCDALAAAEFYPAIAVMGSKPSEEVVKFISKKTLELGLNKLVLIPDQDNISFVGYFTGDFLSTHKLVLIVPPHKDLAATSHWERTRLFKNSL